MGDNRSGYPGVISAREPTTKKPLEIYGDSTSRAIYTGAWIYNPVTDAWEKQQRGGDELFWKDVRRDWTSGKLDYVGKNTTHKALTAATSWYIWKYTWDGGNNTRKELLTGSWDGRAALAWG